MQNPYAAPAVDLPFAASKEKVGWRFTLAALGLGLLWWAALMVPEMTRGILLGDRNAWPMPTPALALAWGFARVVGLVTFACFLFRALQRTWPRVSWLSALACLWGGSAAFALTLFPFEPEALLTSVFVAPFFFVLFAWYVVLPTLVITVVVLSRFRRTGGA